MKITQYSYHRKTWVFGLLALFLLAGCYGTIHLKEEKPAETESLDLASVERGRSVYMENCQTCHGEDGRGDTPRNGQFENPPPDLTKTGLHVTTTGLESIVDYPFHSRQAMRRRIRHGTRDMPEFRNDFSEAEIQDLISFIRFLGFIEKR